MPQGEHASCPLAYNWLKDRTKRYIYIILAINILVGNFVTAMENMKVIYDSSKKHLHEKDEIQLYEDALYFHFIDQGLSEFEAKIRTLHSLTRQ